MKQMLRRVLNLRHQEALLGVLISWILAPLGGAFAGFYLGTIWATPSEMDLRLYDIQRGFLFGAAGLLGGIVFAVLVTLIYPNYVNRDFPHDDHYADGH